jgi:pimeloyl-ACP methyl ester carboxylesterase
MAVTVVLLPGLLCDETVWAGQRAAMAAFSADIETIVPDYSRLDAIHAMAVSVLADVNAPRFSLAGHSMGGRVALEILQIAPERVERLMLLDTGYQPRVPGEVGERERAGRMALLHMAKQEGMREMGRQWARGMVHPSRIGSSVFERIVDMIGRSDADKFAAQINALLERPDATAILSNITCPTTIVCGRQDQWSPLDRHQTMQTHIAGSRLDVVEDAGHMSTMEQPDAVCEIFRTWLASTNHKVEEGT